MGARNGIRLRMSSMPSVQSLPFSLSVMAKCMEVSVGKFVSFVKHYREVYRMHGVPTESLFYDKAEAQISAEGLDGWLSAGGQSPALDV